jgi:glyoxylase-like metal-dependent hydrolase (beta-lactamase superfamily II)
MADGLAPCQEHSGAETEALKAADLSVRGQKLGVLMVIRRALFFSTPGWLNAVLSLLLAAPVQAADRFASVEVALQAITEGVYMLTGAGGNIGVTTGTDGTLIIDDQFAPLADKIAAALTKLGGDRPRLVLNTHFHGDHTGGNAAFGRTGVIIAHDNVRARLMSQGNLPASALPVVTYADAVTIHFNGDELALMHLPQGHTDGDTMVWFKKANVLHMGDQLFNGAFPYIDLGGGGTVDGYIKNLRSVISEMPADITIIPGHGPIADIAAVAECLRVIEGTRQIIVSGVSAGRSDAEIAEDLSAFDDWGQGFINTARWISIIKADHARRGEL